MFRVLLAITLLVGCTAFTGFQSARPRMTMMAEKSKAVPFLPYPENCKGMIGDKGFDPLGFSNYVDMKWLREAELKHARICMLATVGFMATDVGIRLPGEVHNVGSVAAHDAAVSSGSMFQILTAIAAVEFVSCVAVQQMMSGDSDRAPGDFGFDPMNMKGKTAKDMETMQLKEIENGRLAMVAFAGMVTQAALGKGFPYA